MEATGKTGIISASWKKRRAAGKRGARRADERATRTANERSNGTELGEDWNWQRLVKSKQHQKSGGGWRNLTRWM